ncbi:MAG: PQQ-binding-like beta-propeller repeat protein, partial [Anaerolineae bacterium]|nr:PQQ-binding-like beta-propeller repeat protein [Anaerolineae bacterium]
IYGAGPIVWHMGDTPDGPPIAFGDLVLVHGAARGLMAYADRALAWELPAVSRIAGYAVAGDVIAIADRAGMFWFIDAEGRVIDDAEFEAPASVAPMPGGVLLCGDDGIWQVAPSGAWRWLADAPAVQADHSRLAADPDGDGFYLWTGGQARSLLAYDAAGAVRWQRALPRDLGQVTLAIDQTCPQRLIIATARGYVTIFNTVTGNALTEFRLYSEMRLAPFVGQVEGEDLLWLLLDNQLVTFDMTALAGPCQTP